MSCVLLLKYLFLIQENNETLNSGKQVQLLESNNIQLLFYQGFLLSLSVSIRGLNDFCIILLAGFLGFFNRSLRATPLHKYVSFTWSNGTQARVSPVLPNTWLSALFIEMVFEAALIWPILEWLRIWPNFLAPPRATVVKLSSNGIQ